MDVKQILTPIIKAELQKYEGQGKVKLKSALKKRIIYTVICLLAAIALLPTGAFVLVIPVYIILLKKTSNVNIIFSIAKKQPDTPIEEIIRQEIKR